MITINLKDVNIQNYTAILSLIKDLNIKTIDGAEMRSLKNVSIENISMNNFCNIFEVKHMTPENKFKLSGINLKGKYNLINLIDLPKGTFRITVNKSDGNLDSKLSIEKRENLDMIFDKFTPECKVSGILLTKEQSTTEEINISKGDINENKVVYLKDINGVNPNEFAKINLTYDHNKLHLICENVNAFIIINNESEPRVGSITQQGVITQQVASTQQAASTQQVDTTQQASSTQQVDTFTNLENISCTSTGEKLIIALIIFAVYKLLTKRQLIKIFE